MRRESATLRAKVPARISDRITMEDMLLEASGEYDPTANGGAVLDLS